MRWYVQVTYVRIISQRRQGTPPPAPEAHELAHWWNAAYARNTAEMRKLKYDVFRFINRWTGKGTGRKSVLRVRSLGLNFRFIVSASHSINCNFKVSGRQYLVSLQRRNDCSKILTLCQMPPDKSGWSYRVEEKHHIFVENLQMWLTLGNSGNWIHQAPVYKLGKQGSPFFLSVSYQSLSTATNVKASVEELRWFLFLCFQQDSVALYGILRLVFLSKFFQLKYILILSMTFN